MSNLTINRSEWEILREFRKTPFKKRYYEIIESEDYFTELKERELLKS